MRIRAPLPWLYINVYASCDPWKDEGKLGVVMTMGNQDPEWWFDVVGNKAHVKEMAKRFKDDADPLKS
ncbi:MAG: hypothetical protein ACLTXI_01530 [Collinsella sp.]